MTLIKSLLIFSSLICSLAQAKIYIEPLVGYHTGKIDYKLKDIYGGSTDKGTMNGVGFGLGIGWALAGGVTIGAEAQMFNLTSKFEGTTTGDKSNLIASYVVAGYFVQPKARAYLGVGALTSTDDDTPKTTSTGSAIKAGISYEFKNHISGNIEYIAYSINESTTEGSASVKTTDLFDRYLTTAAVWNFRFPFEF